MTDYVERGLQEAASTLEWLVQDRSLHSTISSIAVKMADCFRSGHKVLTCGNGGSFCDAAHLAEELAGRFRRDRAALAGLAISDGAFLTCASNDFGFDRGFSRGVEALGQAGDILVVFSTSGNSPNIVSALEVGAERGLTLIGLLGKDGGRALGFCHEVIVVPGETSDRIQEIHVKLLHLLVEGVERLLFPESYED